MNTTPDLTDDNARYEYARKMGRTELEPTADHLLLLAASCWHWNDCEFGAASMDPKRPYGNGDVEGDLAELLPHLSEQDRLRLHCELPAVLAYIAHNYGESDPLFPYITVVAKDVIARCLAWALPDHIDWEDYPELSLADWEAVKARARQLAPSEDRRSMEIAIRALAERANGQEPQP